MKRMFLPLSLGFGLVFGQSFDVASIRPHQGPLRNIDITSIGTRLEATAAVMQLILYAYDLKAYQVVPGSPNMPLYDFYDVVAKAAGDRAPTRSEFRQMLQSLLAGRFQLKFHREMKEMPVYALVVGPRGSKLKPSAPDASAVGRMMVDGRNYVVTRPKATMDDIVGAITNSFLDRPVIDHTGLTGTYELKLTFTPDISSNRRGEPDPSDISIFTAVQEQLGLKLEPQKAMVEILVVDHIEKPSDN